MLAFRWCSKLLVHQVRVLTIIRIQLLTLVAMHSLTVNERLRCGDLKVQQDRQVLLVRLVRQARLQVRLATRVIRDTQGLVAQQVPRVQQEQTDNSLLQVRHHQHHPLTEKFGTTLTTDAPTFTTTTAHHLNGLSSVKQTKVRQDLQARQVPQVQHHLREPQAIRDIQVLLVRKEQQGIRATRAIRVLLVQQARQVLLAPRVR